MRLLAAGRLSSQTATALAPTSVDQRGVGGSSTLGCMTSEEPLDRVQQAIDEAKAAANRASDHLDTPDGTQQADDAEQLDPRREPPA